MNDPVSEYIAKITSRLHAVPPAKRAATDDATVLSAEIFTILTSREFCYLSRTKTAHYRESVVGVLTGDVHKGEPARFYYDLGAGYHASVHPEESGLVFGVGFSELCVLAQIASFCNRVAGIHPPGASFVLVIDNVCGLLTNDIPLERTTAYCAELRALIDETGMSDRVGVLVESEYFALSGYEIDRARLAKDMAAFTPSPADMENVRRFLGRWCDDAEAAERIARYRQAGEMTERMLEQVVRGVRVTQRATGGTLGFRPFPGGDSRTQVGEVAISPNARGALHPILLTSRNVTRYRCTQLRYPRLLPATIRHVTYAEPIEPASASEGK
ncbi:MAG TPA: hypothetical protein VFO67_09280 [Gemmatimonadales bacterium]|nr:hypothetical protein [Gemmatimonadales bacterium]